MASITFTGNNAASSGTSFEGLSGTTKLFIANFNGADLDGYSRLSGLQATNDGSGPAYESANLLMLTDLLGRETVTGLSFTGGTSTGISTIFDIRGLRFPADFGTADVFSPENYIEFKRILRNCLKGDDNFAISGAVSRLWGDYETAPQGGNGRMGDDIMSMSLISLASFTGSARFFGDVETIGKNATTICGNDSIDASFSTPSVTIYGDAQNVLGTVIFGNDSIFGGSGNDFLYGDSLGAFKHGGNDQLAGGTGNDQLFGGGGNDLLIGGEGVDQLDGGAGFDIASYSGQFGTSTTMVVDLVFDANNTNLAAGETLTGIEGIRGRNYASFGDFLFGDIHDNRIWGMAGNDTLTGRAGADRLYGGEGDDQFFGGLHNDWLTGGTGADFFVFSTSLGSNVDHIADFKPTDDTIRLDDAIFTALSAGPLAASAFRANGSGQAQDASDRIVYETDTGKLFYDKDGTGAADAILFAILDNKANISAADFEIV